MHSNIANEIISREIVLYVRHTNDISLWIASNFKMIAKKKKTSGRYVKKLIFLTPWYAHTISLTLNKVLYSVSS